MEKVKDRYFVPYISNKEIQARVDALADDISKTYEGRFPLFVGILNGSFIFASDLIRKITIPCEVSFVKYSSYVNMESSGKMANLIGFNENLDGRDVIIIEDIVDTGNTMEVIMETIGKQKPNSVAIATLLLKKDVFDKDIDLEYVGFPIENKFVVGYGLDYDGHGRNLPDIYKLAE